MPLCHWPPIAFVRARNARCHQPQLKSDAIWVWKSATRHEKCLKSVRCFMSTGRIGECKNSPRLHCCMDLVNNSIASCNWLIYSSLFLSSLKSSPCSTSWFGCWSLVGVSFVWKYTAGLKVRMRLWWKDMDFKKKKRVPREKSGTHSKPIYLTLKPLKKSGTAL